MSNLVYIQTCIMDNDIKVLMLNFGCYILLTHNDFIQFCNNDVFS